MWNNQVTPEEEEEIINKTAELIHKSGMEVIAILALETYKPLTYFGGQMGRFLTTPFLGALGENAYRRGDKLFTTFEKRENVEKLIKKIEEMEKQ